VSENNDIKGLDSVAAAVVVVQNCRKMPALARKTKQLPYLRQTTPHPKK
jgi:hypothetical protein